MATIHPEKKTFTIDPDELLEIRKEALRAAAMVYQGKGDYRTEEYLNLAKAFEQHLGRKLGDD